MEKYLKSNTILNYFNIIIILQKQYIKTYLLLLNFPLKNEKKIKINENKQKTNQITLIQIIQINKNITSFNTKQINENY